jgi:hypothetical protein
MLAETGPAGLSLREGRAASRCLPQRAVPAFRDRGMRCWRPSRRLANDALAERTDGAADKHDRARAWPTSPYCAGAFRPCFD